MAEQQDTRCDLCNESCTETQANLLACTYKYCEGGMYHQECLEKFLKSNRLEKNRKTGFKCPRGCGKGTKWPEPCPGRIDKSHPIYPRNEEKVKKRQQAVVEQPLAKPSKAEKAKAAAAAKAKADGAKAKAEQDAANGDAGLAKLGKGAVLQPIGKAHKDKQQQQQQLPLQEQLAQAKAAARKEMGLTPSQYPSTMDTPSSSKDTSSSMSRAGSKTLAPTSAWGKSGGSGAASHHLDIAPPPPELPTLGQLPLLQQLMQQSESKRRPRQPPSASQHHPAPSYQPPPPQHAQHANGSATQQSQPQLDSIQHFPPVSIANPTASVPRLVPVASSYASAAPSTTREPPVAAAPASQQQPHHPPQPPPHSDLGMEASEQSELPSLPDGELLDCGDADAQAAAAALKLSKAQRKNLKRADKKKKKTGSILDGVDQTTPSDTASIAESDQDPAHAGHSNNSTAATIAAPAVHGVTEGSLLQGSGSDEQGCIEALVAHKALHVFQQLLRLGFQRWQAASALQCFGLQLQLGVEWLLLHLSDPPAQLAAAAVGTPLPVVDIASDLQHLQEAQSILRAPQDLLHRAVIKARGDVQAAVMSLAQASTPPLHRPSSGAAVRHSHQPSIESFHSAQSDMQSFPSQDLSSLDVFPTPSPHPAPPQHRLSLGHASQPSPSMSSSWLPGLASANGGSSPAPGPEAGSREGGGSSRLSAWLRNDQPLEQAALSSGGFQEGNPWGSSPLLGQYSGSQQGPVGSLLGLIR